MANLSTTEKALSGTAVALIIVAVVVGVIFAAVGGKKGYDYWKSQQESINGIVSNPLYEGPQNGFTNPLFEENTAL